MGSLIVSQHTTLRTLQVIWQEYARGERAWGVAMYFQMEDLYVFWTWPRLTPVTRSHLVR